MHVEVSFVSVPGGDIGHRALVFELALERDSIWPQICDNSLLVCGRLDLASMQKEANSSSVFLLTAKVHQSDLGICSNHWVDGLLCYLSRCLELVKHLGGDFKLSLDHGVAEVIEARLRVLLS